jgi:hypothetical protein
VLPLVMVRDDLLMTGDTSFAAKHFDELVTNALGSTGTPVSDSYLAESGCSAFIRPPIHVGQCTGIMPVLVL